jgi:hypothetical protein
MDLTWGEVRCGVRVRVRCVPHTVYSLSFVHDVAAAVCCAISINICSFLRSFFRSFVIILSCRVVACHSVIVILYIQ